MKNKQGGRDAQYRTPFTNQWFNGKITKVNKGDGKADAIFDDGDVLTGGKK